MRPIFVFLILTIPNLIFAQQKLNLNEIATEILVQINDYRDSIGSRILKTNPILEKAAKDQADYMNWQQELSHDQITYNKQTPSERVFFYGGNFNYIGENVALTTIIKKDSLYKSSKEIATQFFTQWINSTGHRENIENDFYYQSGISFSFDKEKKQLYATNVFSALGYDFPKQLQTPSKAYGVQHFDEAPCKGVKNFRYGTLDFANSIYTKGDSIFIRYHDLNYFNRVISDPNDGYAIDIVFRSQLPCNSPNLFHGSEIFDGFMLAPKFRYELLSNNRSENPKKLITYLGKLPKGLPPHELNLILIKDNHRCDYSYPVQVPSDDIPPFYIAPLTLNETHLFEPFSIDTVITIPYSFNRSSSDWNMLESYDAFYEIYKYRDFIQSIDLQAYSSVEGKTWFNEQIQKERATKMEQFFSEWAFDKDSVSFHKIAKENWEKFEEQIQVNNLAEFQNKTHEEIKRYLKLNNKEGKYDSLLFQQRISSTTFKINGTISNLTQTANRFLAWENALENKDISACAHFLKMAVDSNSTLREVYDTRIDSTFYESLPFATNALANFILGKRKKLPEELKNDKIRNLSLNNKTNIYYTLNWINLYYHDLYRVSNSYWSDPEKDKPVVSPKEVFRILRAIDISENVSNNYLSRLKLNQSLASIHYYTWINNWTEANKYFEYIFDYFYTAELPIEQAHDLALFVNLYSRFDRTVEMLDHYYKQDLLDEDASFTLAKTATLLQDEITEEKYLGYMKKALEFNPIRWCAWLNGNFQVMRNETVKDMYCDVCQ